MDLVELLDSNIVVYFKVVMGILSDLGKLAKHK